MKPETSFRTGQVDQFLDSLSNCVHESIQQVSIRGSFDKIACIHGWYVGIELKATDGLPDQLQSYNATKIRNKALGIAFVWRPQNHEQVKKFLMHLNAGIFDKAMLAKINKEENNL